MKSLFILLWTFISILFFSACGSGETTTTAVDSAAAEATVDTTGGWIPDSLSTDELKSIDTTK